ncbi:AMP-binding protein [Piscinibacter sp. HJYY11]|uniref:AMP-binding protein n=1 Tax=Piscinibacter sp. HJYY11 TaxID=2801333 RepID=UPI00191F13D6|nr:AMP-binding protein [Piscinibacter sp. HJYY11]MBL0727286.1 AMP-binding protein [Piscinibacter sp. HJYY11]
MTTDFTVSNHHLALARLYHFESVETDRVAFVQPMGAGFAGEVREVTWGDAIDQARRIAQHLRTMGLPPGSRIAILSKNCVHWLLADYAIWMAGHVSVPLYPTLAPSSMAQILEHSEARLLFVGKLDDWGLLQTGIPRGLRCIAFPLAPANDFAQWDTIVESTARIPGHPLRPADDLATIIYTSGTTGVPKGVMHTFGTLAWAAQAGIRRVPLQRDGRVFSYLPLAHAAERTMVEHGQLATGARVYFADSLDTFVTDLQRARPTVFFSVPRLWLKFQQNILQQVPRRKLKLLLSIPGLRVVVRRKILRALGLDACIFAIGGAAPMPPELLRWYGDLRLYIADVYGMTENGALSHSTLPLRQRIGTVGWPVDGVQSRLDPETGEIQLLSGGLMKGYFKAPAQTAEAFTPDGWLRTGDKGQLMRDDGALKIVGRVKDLFKTSKGRYVAPAPIEDSLVMHDSVEACVVVGSGLAQPIGLLSLNEATWSGAADSTRRQRLLQSLDRHLTALNQRLDPHERLDRLVVVGGPWTVEDGLVTPTLKVKRHSVEARYAQQLPGWSAQHAPVIWAAQA